MENNNNNFNNQNSSSYPHGYQNPNNFQNQNHQFFNHPPQNMPNYGFPSSFNPTSSAQNYTQYLNPSSSAQNYTPYGSMMGYSSQTPPGYSSQRPSFGYMPMGTENVQSVGAPEFPGFSTQTTPGGMAAANQVTPDPEDSTPKSKKSQQPGWTTQQNLVLISAWIKYGTDSIVGKNQRGSTFWNLVADSCNEYCSFDEPRDHIACRNRFNYMSSKINKWIGAYESAKRLQGSGWSENDVLRKAQELYACGGTNKFILMEEWQALRDQPRYLSQVGGNIGSGSSGSKRSHDGDASGSNSVGSTARPMGREAAKKKAKKKSKDGGVEEVAKEWVQFKQIRETEIEQMKELTLVKKEKNQLKRMEMYLKLRDEEHLDDEKKNLLEMLKRQLF
jgi:hypothetical protein